MSKATARAKPIQGDDVLYRFFKEELLSDPDLSGTLALLMVTSLGIWFPPSTYSEWPILLPHVVRDNQCRVRKSSKGAIVQPEAWGTPNSRGYLRDDNSLIKGLPRGMKIISSRFSDFNGRTLGKAFVASHIWRDVDGQTRANHDPSLNSFIPNLVWLPRQVSKLSDLPGSPIMNALKRVSFSIYRHLPVASPLNKISESCWRALNYRGEPIDVGRLQLNWFAPGPKFVPTRVGKVRTVTNLLTSIDSGVLPTAVRGLPSRYVHGMSSVPREARTALLEQLRVFAPS